MARRTGEHKFKKSKTLIHSTKGNKNDVYALTLKKKLADPALTLSLYNKCTSTVQVVTWKVNRKP